MVTTESCQEILQKLLDFDWKLVNLFRHNYYVKVGALYKCRLNSHWYQSLRAHAY